MTILNIRGTSGSGKSTAVRALMALASEVTPHMADASFGKKRKNPLWYSLDFPRHSSVAVLGHYGADCGGCDTLPTYDFIMGLIRACHEDGFHVVYEGLLLSHDKKQTKALWEWLGQKEFAVLELTETVETCLASVRERRARKGAPPEFNTDNTVRRHAEVIRASVQLEEVGIPVHRVSREQCLPKVLELINLKLPVEAAA